MTDGLTIKIEQICGLTANGEGHHGGDPDCICAEIRRLVRTQPIDRDGKMITQSVANGLMAEIDRLQAAADEARAEERKWVREQVAELKKVSGWKCELIERMDAREASDE